MLRGNGARWENGVSATGDVTEVIVEATAGQTKHTRGMKGWTTRCHRAEQPGSARAARGTQVGGRRSEEPQPARRLLHSPGKERGVQIKDQKTWLEHYHREKHSAPGTVKPTPFPSLTAPGWDEHGETSSFIWSHHHEHWPCCCLVPFLTSQARSPRFLSLFWPPVPAPLTTYAPARDGNVQALGRRMARSAGQLEEGLTLGLVMPAT